MRPQFITLLLLLCAVKLSGEQGNALNFDGVNDCIIIPHNALLKPSTAITIEAWIKPVNIHTNTYYEIYRKEDLGARQLFSFQNNGTVLSFGLVLANIYSEFDVTILPSDYENQWVHVAATYDGKARKIYRNGILIGSQNAGGSMATSDVEPAIIGSFNGSGEFFNGTIDEFSLWNRALTTDEIKNNMNCKINAAGQTGLVVLYHFDQGIGEGNNAEITSLNDASGNNVNGTLSGFSLAGTVSNWLSQGGVPDKYCISPSDTYTFIGNGNWSDSANWAGRNVPLSFLINDAAININPANDGECVIDVPLHIPQKTSFNIFPGAKVRILGDLNMSDTSIALKDNVKVIDTSLLVLQSTAEMLDAGIYQYTGTSFPEFKNNDILVGPSGLGYVRKITAVSITGNTVKLETTQANIEDVFKKGNFSFSFPTDQSLQKMASSDADGYTYTFNNIDLYQADGLSIKLNNGTISLTPDWHFDFSFSNGAVNYFRVGTENASLQSNFSVNVAASKAVTLIDKTTTLKSVSHNFTNWVFVYGVPVPVVLQMKLDFIAKFSASIDASVNSDITFTSNNNFGVGIAYLNSNWTPTYSVNSSNTIEPKQISGNVKSTVNVAIVPTFSFKLYGLAGPYASMGLEGSIQGNIASPSLDWDFLGKTWLNTEVGISAEAIGHTLFDYKKNWQTDALLYRTPFSMAKMSNGYNGYVDLALPQPVKVQVLDEWNKPQSNVPVYFSVTGGSGQVGNASFLTDLNGIAQTQWQLGNETGMQSLKAEAKKADGSLLVNAPVEFTASRDATPSILGSNWQFSSPCWWKGDLTFQCTQANTGAWSQVGTSVSFFIQSFSDPSTGSTCYYTLTGTLLPGGSQISGTFTLTSIPLGYCTPGLPNCYSGEFSGFKTN